MQSNPFDKLTARYDAWYDSDQGSNIFAIEVACLRELLGDGGGKWLEVGVGTGRFAKELGVVDGLDPSLPMLGVAATRGLRGVAGGGESLPYLDACFDGVLLAITICFLDDPASVLHQCARVLTKDGSLIVGIVPADSAWGRFYRKQGREGHPFYAIAKFYSCDEVIGMAERAGFVFDEARSCLFGRPGEAVERCETSRTEVIAEAGFVGLRFSSREKVKAGSSKQPPARAKPQPP